MARVQTQRTALAARQWPTAVGVGVAVAVGL